MELKKISYKIEQNKKPPIFSEQFPFKAGNEALSEDLSICFISMHVFIQHTWKSPTLPKQQTTNT